MGLALFYNIYLFYIKFFVLVLFSFFLVLQGALVSHVKVKISSVAV